MRIVGILWAVLFAGRAAAADEEFPYLATVTHEAVLVRSGPGEGFYPTCRLLKGAEVEVHRHGPSGWCAIRPPAGEFSLIASDNVKLLPGDDLVEVVDQEAAVWMGSHIAKPDQHRWQIHLQPGERAVVLGVRTGAGEAGKAVAWYKIAPPAGEFRWVPRETLTQGKEPVHLAEDSPAPEMQQEAFVSESPPPSNADDFTAATPLPDPSADTKADESGSDVLPAPAGEQVDPDAPSEVIQASVELPVESDIPLTPIPDEAAHQQQPQEAPLPPMPPFRETDLRIEPRPRAAREEEPLAPAADEIGASQGAFDAAATALQVDLTLAVAQDLSRWRLGPLRDRAERLRDNAPSPESRQETANLLASIARFEQLYDRYLHYAHGGSAAGSGPRAQTVGLPQQGNSDRFAAVGRLAPLSPELNTPPFALLDEDGRIQAYVTPVEGLNLAKYAGAIVGVDGHSGMDEKLQTPHVTAAGVRMLRR